MVLSKDGRRYNTLLGTTYSLATRLAIANALFSGLAEFVTYLAVLAVILFGTYLILGGEISIDFISAFFSDHLLT